MADRIKPVSKVGKVRKAKLKLHRHRTMKGLYFNEMYSRIYGKNDIKQFEKENKIEENDNNSEKHIIDILC